MAKNAPANAAAVAASGSSSAVLAPVITIDSPRAMI
jgi:hypothetical protein